MNIIIFCGAFLIFLISSFVLIDALEIPSSVGKCSRSDPKLNDCMKEKMEKALHVLRDGNKKLGLNKIEPFEVPEITIGEGKGPVDVVQHFKNVRLYGISDTKVMDVDADVPGQTIAVNSLSPKLILDADYELNGKVLLLAIHGKGKCKIILENVAEHVIISGEEYKKNGKLYWKIKKFAITLSPKKVIFKFDNLSDGDEALSKQLHKVLNDNWEEIFNDIKSGYEDTVGLILRDYTERIFSKASIDELFLS